MWLGCGALLVALLAGARLLDATVGDGALDRRRECLQSPGHVGVRDGQRRKQLENLVVRATGLEDEATFERQARGFLRHLGIVEGKRLDEAATTMSRARSRGQAGEARLTQSCLLVDLLGEVVIAPELLDCSRSSDEGVIETAEGAVVLARVEDVELGAHQSERHG